MRNLTVHQIGRRDLQLKDAEINPEVSKRVQCAVNPNSNDIYMLLDEHLYIISRDRDVNVLNFSQYCTSRIIAMEYCVTLQELYCAYESGYIARVDIKDPSRIDYTVVTTFNSGLQCMKFSPDHELIAAVTSAGILITMVLDFQIMSEVMLGFKLIKFCFYRVFDQLQLIIARKITYFLLIILILY